MKICDSWTLRPLSIIFKNCLLGESFPNIWKKSNVALIRVKYSMTFFHFDFLGFFRKIWISVSCIIQPLIKLTNTSKCIRGRNNLFLLDWSFLVLMQSHCSSPIATKDFGSAVIPLFCLAFAGSFPHFSYKEVPDP